jgi:hypothetical protein
MSDAEAAYFTRVISKNQGSVFGVPVWGERGVLTAQAPASQTYIDLTDVDKMNFEVGGLLVLFKDYETYEVREISSKTTTRLNFLTGLSSTWESGSIVYPMIHMTIDKTLSYRKVTSSYGGSSIVFKEAWNEDVEHELASHTFPTYNGFTVFNKKPNWREGFSFSINRSSEFLQKLGVQIRYTREAESEFLVSGSYLWDGLDECLEIRGFFNECMGKWKQFWLPTWQRDVILTGAITSTDTSLTIEDIEYSSYWAGNSIIGKYLFILLPDDTEIYRRVKDWPTPTTLTLNKEVGHDVSADEIDHTLVSFLLPARFEIDEMEMSFYKPTVADNRLRMQSLHDDTMGFSTTTTTTTSTTTTTTVLPYEDFLLWDETDSGGYITVTQTKVRTVATEREVRAFVQEEYTPGIKNFTFQCKIRIDTSDTSSSFGNILLSKVGGTIQDGFTDDFCLVLQTAREVSDSSYRVWIRDYETDNSDFYICSANTDYWVEFERSGSTVTAKIYSDTFTTLLDTLTLTGSNKAYKYLGVATREFAGDQVTSETENLKIVSVAYGTTTTTV